MQAEELPSTDIDEKEMIEYLRSNPNFFVRNTHLLTELDVPHVSGQAVSLVEHQISIMRDRNVEMRRQMNELLSAARQNDDLFRKTRSLTLALVDVKSLQELNEVLATFVLVDFDADFVCTHVQGGNFSLDHIQNHAEKFPFAHLLKGSKAICTTLRQDEVHRVFPSSNHTGNGSAVLLPLQLERGDAALCIGSRDPHRFSKEMDTLFVGYIADVLSKVLNRL